MQERNKREVNEIVSGGYNIVRARRGGERDKKKTGE